MSSTNKTGKEARKINILGAGPAGLYLALLLKQADSGCHVTVIERNAADVTYGWGVVFSDRTLASFQRADYKTYQQIADGFVIWDAIDVRYRGETVRCGGHVIASIARKRLLAILQARCAELGVRMVFSHEVGDISELYGCDLLVAADGVNSIVRKGFEDQFKSTIELGKARYIWLGATKVLDAFNFIFHENAHGLFQVHAYPFSGTMSTFIVECDEASWRNAGLDTADEDTSLAYCRKLLADDLQGAELLSNNSKWINFPTLKTRQWSLRGEQKIVLLGDAVHTAHFSIGAGTKLAMEDAIALANALSTQQSIDTALDAYEAERKPVVEVFQRAASESQAYFETIKRYLGLDPETFAFQLLTRSGRISYDDLHFRDAQFGDEVDRHFAARGSLPAAMGPTAQEVTRPTQHHIELFLAPSPVFTPLAVGALQLPNRIVAASRQLCASKSGTPCERYAQTLAGAARGRCGLIMTDICAVSAEGRITPESPGIYAPEHQEAWRQAVSMVRAEGSHLGIRLGHAGRRGATHPRRFGLDVPMKEGAWKLMSASALPYTPRSQTPGEMDEGDMESVLGEYVRAAEMAREAGFSLLQLHMAHGYLLASFLSPLTNTRTDPYGGSIENRARFPLRVLAAVREVWGEAPICVAITATDCVKGGATVEDAVTFSKLLREQGCELIEVLAGQTTPASEPRYGRGFLTAYSDRIRNEAGVRTMVGGYITTSNEANTVLAAGRADLCIITHDEAPL